MDARISSRCPIRSHHSAGHDGSLDWLCFPRFDSEAVFAALLGTEENGHSRLAPRAGSATCTSRRYRGDTMILETEWAAPGGTVRVIDFMPERDEAPDVVRIVETRPISKTKHWRLAEIVEKAR